MTRGSHRRDSLSPPTTDWIDYSAPAETWEYWGKRFGKDFSPELRNRIALALAGFRAYRRTYNLEPSQRKNKKGIERTLRSTAGTGRITDPVFRRWMEAHTLDYPDASVAEKASRLLEEFLEKPDDFLIERPKPNPLFTRNLYDLFHEHGLDVSLGSAGDLYSISKDQRLRDAPETAFVEFVRRCVWDESNSVKFCTRIQTIIKRCPICSKL